MRIRDEELVQYLLGDADATLRLRVEAALATDPSVVKRIDELRAALGLLDSLKLAPEPPSDLIARTMMRIEADIAAGAEAAALDSQVAQRSPRRSEPVELRRSSNSLN